MVSLLKLLIRNRFVSSVWVSREVEVFCVFMVIFCSGVVGIDWVVGDMVGILMLLIEVINCLICVLLFV